MFQIVTGLISGIVSGTGMGGGTILILILSFFFSIEQHIAQGTNLIFFIPTSISAIIVTLKEKLIDYKIRHRINYIWNNRSNYWCFYFNKNGCKYFKKMLWNFFRINCNV